MLGYLCLKSYFGIIFEEVWTAEWWCFNFLFLLCFIVIWSSKIKGMELVMATDHICYFSGMIYVVSRDVHKTFWAETKTRPRHSKFFLIRDRDKMFIIQDETEARHCSFQEAGRDLEAAETLESLRSSNVSPRLFLWRMVKHIDNEKNYTN